MIDHDDDLPRPVRLTPEQAADYLGVTPGTLRNWRCQRRGPPFFKKPRTWYLQSDLDDWVRKSKICPRCA